MLRALRMEWTKLRTMPSTAWWLLGAVGLTLGMGTFATLSMDVDHCWPHCDVDTAKLSLTGVYLGQLAVAAVAALAVTGEYDTMMIRTTLGAAPRRLTVLAAKLAVVTTVVLAAGLVTVLGSLAAGRGILLRHGFTAANGYLPLSLAAEPVRRSYLGTVLYLALVAALSLGLGAALRHTAATLSAVVGLLYVLPIVAPFVSDPVWHARLERYSPMTAGLAIQATRDLAQLPIQPWPGLGVLAGYAAAAVLVGAVLFRIRDA
jgi:ABC-2 type transport system permease protein